MIIKCTLVAEYKNHKIAEQILGATRVDDFDFVVSQIDGRKLVATIESNSINSLLHTLDDYLACLSVAEKVVNND